MRIVCLLLLSFLTLPIAADAWKIRAREHFDVYTYQVSGAEYEYRGFSNTINVWYERPLDWSFGLALSPVLGSAEAKDEVAPGFSEEIKVWHLGIEAKYFPWQGPGVFVRGGVYHERVDTDGTFDTLNGFGGYVGAGYEFLIKGIGVAIEGGYRRMWLEHDVDANGPSLALGVHFYGLL